MKIAIIGASGWIGSTIATEALLRGHDVIGIARQTEKLPAAITTRRALDIRHPEQLAEAVQGADIVISSVGGRGDGNLDIVSTAAHLLLDALPATDTQRLFWVGGAGTLEVAPGVTLLSMPAFPEAYRAEATAMAKALEVFRASASPVQWTFISPAAEIFPGERTGHYRVANDQLLLDDEGNSRISVQDYAVALLDMAEQNLYPCQRVGVAY